MLFEVHFAVWRNVHEIVQGDGEVIPRGSTMFIFQFKCSCYNDTDR